jgi:hypothetical protein
MIRIERKIGFAAHRCRAALGSDGRDARPHTSRITSQSYIYFLAVGGNIPFWRRYIAASA